MGARLKFNTLIKLYQDPLLTLDLVVLDKQSTHHYLKQDNKTSIQMAFDKF